MKSKAPVGVVEKAVVASPLTGEEPDAADDEPGIHRKRTLTRMPSGFQSKIQAGVRVVASILRIDEVLGEFDADVEIYLMWKQPDLIVEGADDAYVRTSMGEFLPKEDASPEEVAQGQGFRLFHPKITIIAYQKMELIEESCELNRSTGDICCLLNFIVTFREPLELHSFPFDRQQFTMAFESASGFTFGPCTASEHELNSFMPDKNLQVITSLDLWKLEGVTASVESGGESMVVILLAGRNPTYYGVNVLSIMFLIVVANAVSYGVSVHDTADRASITLTLLLTAVAFKFVITADLPKISYLTLMDKYMLVAFVVLGLSIAELLIVSPMITPNIDRAEKVDLICTVAINAFWVIFHLIIIIGGYYHWFCEPWDKVRAGENEHEDEVTSDDIEMIDDEDEDEDEEQEEGSKQAGSTTKSKRSSIETSGGVDLR